MNAPPEIWSFLMAVLPHWLPHGVVYLAGLIVGCFWLTRSPRAAYLLLTGSGLHLLCMGGSISLMAISFGVLGGSWSELASWGQYGLSFLGAVCDALIIVAVVIDRAPRFPSPSDAIGDNDSHD